MNWTTKTEDLDTPTGLFLRGRPLELRSALKLLNRLMPGNDPIGDLEVQEVQVSEDALRTITISGNTKPVPAEPFVLLESTDFPEFQGMLLYLPSGGGPWNTTQVLGGTKLIGFVYATPFDADGDFGPTYEIIVQLSQTPG